MPLLPILLLVIVVAILAGFLRAIDYERLRSHPEGLVSPGGAVLVIAGGFVVGLVYGGVTGLSEEGWTWLFRALTVGSLTAAAGAFYIGSQQRRDRRRGDGRD